MTGTLPIIINWQVLVSFVLWPLHTSHVFANVSLRVSFMGFVYNLIRGLWVAPLATLDLVCIRLGYDD